MSEDIFQQLEADAQARLNAVPTDVQASTIGKLGAELALLEQRMEKGEELMAQLQARKQVIVEKELVDAMDAVGQVSMGLADGVTVEVGTKYRAVLPALPRDNDKDWDAKMAKRQAGLDWLRSDGHEGLIETQVVLTFPRGMDQMAKQIAAELMDRAKQREDMDNYAFKVEVAESVHWSSLTSLIKNLMESHGRADLPLASLGARVFRLAEIKKRKQDRRK